MPRLVTQTNKPSFESCFNKIQNKLKRFPPLAPRQAQFWILVMLQCDIPAGTQTSPVFNLINLSCPHSVVDIPPRHPDKPSFDIVAVMDPLSPQAQKWSHILMVLTQVINVKVKVFMNPKDMLSEMPLKRLVYFFRDVILYIFNRKSIFFSGFTCSLINISGNEN